ncbi:DUF885 domain-containing protein [Pelagibius litoralis]|uniref:DUF885 domain-containing protein n=1 Tax=Pelagibius litoralis TaxID=374515 RepID=A0A967F3H9_9PROT|nr:DUF885 domain-containing protein [Pelagibius litoralis]NIA72319.1 DUF885 domain-containing protein [Pelagibius litoralis]
MMTSIRQDNGHLLPAVSDACQRLLTDTVSQFKLHQPIQASVWGPPIVSEVEDLTVGGVLAWRDVLSSTHRLIDQTKPLTSGDSVFLSELRIWCEREHQIDSYDDPAFSRRLTTCKTRLQLIAFGLLPFVIGRLMNSPVDPVLMEQRCRTFCSWVLDALRRHTDKQITVHRDDLRNAARISDVLDTLPSERAPFPATVAAALMRLKELLRDLSCLMPVTFAGYPENGHGQPTVKGLTIETSVLGDQVSEALFRTLKQAKIGFAASCKAREWSNTKGSVEMKAKHLCQTIVTRSLGLIDPPETEFILSPSLVSPFVTDGLLLPGWGAGASDLVLLPRSFEEPSFRQSAKIERALRTLIGHEVWPGHGMHLKSASKSCFHQLFSMYRSQVSFEGWAVWAEGLAWTLDHKAEALPIDPAFHRLRRLIPAHLTLSNRSGQLGNAEQKLRKEMQTLPAALNNALQRFLDPRLGVSQLPYVIGFIEIGQCLERLGRNRLSDLLSMGPLSPKALSDLQLAQVSSLHAETDSVPG